MSSENGQGATMSIFLPFEEEEESDSDEVAAQSNAPTWEAE